MKNKIFATLIALAGLASFGTCAIDAMSNDQDEMVFNRQWVDKMPRGDTDLITVFIPIDNEEGEYGATFLVSQWRQYLDIFLWEKRGDDSLYILYPQDEKKETVKYKAWECDKPPFELCMEMGGKMYFSRWDWEIESTQDKIKALENL